MTKHSVPLGNTQSINVTIKRNPFNLKPADLFELAYRHNNNKRSFIFVSKVLGKHTHTDPYALQDRADKLAEAYKRERPVIDSSKTVVLGFAEAGTALGRCFANALGDDVYYIHSTRHEIEGRKPTFSFREEHSHAPCHNFYFNNPAIIKDAEDIILIDDEITTGNTALNIIRAIDKEFPGKRFGLSALLDWRTEEYEAKFDTLLEDEGISLYSRSLIQGTLDLDKIVAPEGEAVPYVAVKGTTTATKWNNMDYHDGHEGYLVHEGRFGVGAWGRRLVDCMAKAIARQVDWAVDELPDEESVKAKALVIGVGEFQYIPMRAAQFMCTDARFQSITRTPNIAMDEEGYPIKTAVAFDSPIDPSRLDYLYNLNADEFTHAVLVLERNVDIKQVLPVMQIIEDAGFKHCIKVTCCE